MCRKQNVFKKHNDSNFSEHLSFNVILLLQCTFQNSIKINHSESFFKSRFTSTFLSNINIIIQYIIYNYTCMCVGVWGWGCVCVCRGGGGGAAVTSQHNVKINIIIICNVRCHSTNIAKHFDAEMWKHSTQIFSLIV